MSNRVKFVLILLYLSALVAGILAVVLLFWVSTEIEHGVQEVQVNKQIDSGLFLKYERFNVKQNKFNGSDDWWTGLANTSLDTKSLKIVTGLLMTGMAVLTVSFICAVVILCCSPCSSKRDLRLQLIVLSVMLFLAAGFVAVGVIVFFKQVLDDYKIGENDKHLGASFWLAVTSSVITFLTGVFTSYRACCVGQENLT